MDTTCTITATERKIARELRQHVQRIEPMLKVTGTLADYFTVYTDWQRSHERHVPDYSATFKTRLYQVHSFEYCVLLEVLAGVR